ncbi:hypothetical protein [Aeromonas sp. Prich7-2]|uniref:hypothetical protein n=1 Tax=Aeromonas sp. Prich7-2 TaxID=2823361 RepID=UPI001B32E4DF|nr:hypothetical protein [Aeromonas sp. Prich7-2]MBP4060805.1 hypothetical protein [Aeromonas sp. Prich7-2]
MITGLGYAFQEDCVRKRILNKLVKALYRFALRKADKVIFQNKDDLAVFVDNKWVSKEKYMVVNASGVVLRHYERAPLSDKAVFRLIARLLGAKGIREYIFAAEQVS